MQEELRTYRRRKYLLYVCAFLMDFALGVYLVIAPIMAVRRTESNIVIGSTGVIFLGARILLQFLFGKLSDYIGRKKLILLSLVIFALSALTLLFAVNIPVLLLSFLLAGSSNALFWPILEAWIGDDVQGTKLIRSIGAFNIAFSFGLAIGAVIAGYLEMIAPANAVALALLLAFISFVLVLSRPGHSPRRLQELSSEEDHGVSERRDPVFLKVGWIANLLSWGGVGVIRFLFAKLSTDLGYSPGNFGFMVFCFYFSMCITFVVLRKLHFWQYRLASLLGAQIIGVIGFSLIGLFENEVILCAGLVFFGVTVATTYFSSIYYGLDGHIDKGTKSGMHETCLAIGMAAAVLVGSVLAEHISIHAPYLLVSGSIFIGMIIETSLFVRKRGKRTA